MRLASSRTPVMTTAAAHAHLDTVSLMHVVLGALPTTRCTTSSCMPHDGGCSYNPAQA